MNTNVINTLHILSLEEVLEIVKIKKAVIFDMDGTVLDSECLHFEAIQKLTNNQSTYSQHDLYGMADPDVFMLLKDYFQGSLEDFLAQKISMMKSVIPNGKLAQMLLTDMPNLLRQIKQRGQKLALVTASERSTTHALLKHCSLFDIFDLIITRDDTTQSKPHPMPYQHAITMLNVSKSDAIIFEDSPTGIQAALASQIDTVQVKWYALK